MSIETPHPLNTPLPLDEIVKAEPIPGIAPRDHATAEDKGTPPSKSYSIVLETDLRDPMLPEPVRGDWYCDKHKKNYIHHTNSQKHCIECGQARPADGSCSVTDAPQWWWMHKKGWRMYDEKTMKRIEQAYIRGDFKLSIKSGKKGSRPYGIFFDEMLQFDPETKVERKICRSGRFAFWQIAKRFVGKHGKTGSEDGRSRIQSLHQYKEQQERIKMSDEQELAVLAEKDLYGGLRIKGDSVGCGSTVLNKIKENYWLFELISMLAVMLNALWIAVEADWNDAPTMASSHVGFQATEYAFCFIFTVELLIRFLLFPVKSDAFKDKWFRFDGCLVVMMITESWLIPFTLWIFKVDQSRSSGLGNLSVLRLARLIRLTRVSRLVRWAPEIMTLLKGILMSVRSVMFTYLLLMFLLYVFGIIFKTLEDYYEGLQELEHFTTMRRAMWTLLLHGLFLDEVSTLLNDMQDASGDFTCFVFLLFVLLGHFTILNMVIGFQCEVAQRVSQKDKSDAEEYYLRQNLLTIMECYDKDDSKFLEKKEFQLLLQDPDVHDCLKRFGTDPEDLDHMADVVFRDKQAEAVLGQSRLNDKYFCNILRAEEREDGDIKIWFDAYCDGSEGDLADPSDSMLTDRKPKAFDYEVDQPRSNIKGTLTYGKIDLDSSHGKAYFRFGPRSDHYALVELHIKRAILGYSRSLRNESYVCTILEVESTSDGVRVSFVTEGDGTMGNLPDAALSTLAGKKPGKVIYDDGFGDDSSNSLRREGVLVFESMVAEHSFSAKFQFGGDDYTSTDLLVPRKEPGCRLSFLETLDLVQRLRGSKNSQVTDIVELREYVRRLFLQFVNTRGNREDRLEKFDFASPIGNERPHAQSPSSRPRTGQTPSARPRISTSLGTAENSAEKQERVPVWVDSIVSQLSHVTKKIQEIEERLPSKELLARLDQPSVMMEQNSC